MEMLEPLWQQSAKKTVEDRPTKFSPWLRLCNIWLSRTWLSRTNTWHCGKTNLFNQQEFLEGNEGAQAQDMVGSVVGYTLDHHQGHLLHSENVQRL